MARKTSPWSVKGIDEETRDVIRSEAKSSEQKIGAWINALIIEEGRRSSANDAGQDQPEDTGQRADPGSQDHGGAPDRTPTGTAVASPIDVAAIVERELAEAEGRLDDALRPLAVSVHALASRLVEAETAARRRAALAPQRRIQADTPPEPEPQSSAPKPPEAPLEEDVIRIPETPEPQAGLQAEPQAEPQTGPQAEAAGEPVSRAPAAVPDPGDWTPPVDPDLVESLSRGQAEEAAPEDTPAPVNDAGPSDAPADLPTAPEEDFDRHVDADDIASADSALPDAAIANASIDRRLEALAKEIREEMSREGGTRFAGVQDGMDTRPDLAHREALETAVENAVAADARRRRRLRTVLMGSVAASVLLVVAGAGVFVAVPEVADRAGLASQRAVLIERSRAFLGDVGPAIADAWRRVEADMARTMGTAKKSVEEAAPPVREQDQVAVAPPQAGSVSRTENEEAAPPTPEAPVVAPVEAPVEAPAETVPEQEEPDAASSAALSPSATSPSATSPSATSPSAATPAPSAPASSPSITASLPETPATESALPTDTASTDVSDSDDLSQEVSAEPTEPPITADVEDEGGTQVAALPPRPTVTAPAIPTPAIPEAPQTRPRPSAPRDAEVAALETRASSGDVLAQYQLAVRYIVGTGIDRDPEMAANWFREAAIQGEAAAQYNLAVLYERGEGVRQDDIRALLWYHSAADQSHPLAQLNLARFYALGRGVPQSYEESARWYEAAAAQGMAKAYYNLSEMYRNGLGVDRDLAKAEELAGEAIRLGWDGPIDPDAADRAEEAEAVRAGISAGEGLQESLPVGEATVFAIQETLREDGLYDGRVDGLVGPKTRAAIRAYETIHGLPETGAPTEALLDFMRLKSAGAG